MPIKPSSPCSVSGCPQRAIERGRCDRHALEYAVSIRPRNPQRPTRQELGYGAEWQRIRARHLQQEPYCVVCLSLGIIKDATIVDHIVAKSRGGTDDDGNLQSLCPKHHNRKTNHYDGGWGNRRATGG